ncbi:MAG: hypothetical protein KDB80_09290 [Planctomycetes bacterium]|nr:hypothetical protein [Planctomycetota bacterium]
MNAARLPGVIRNHFSTLLLAVVATSAVTAQAPLVRISVAGPESVRRAILPTNVGSLLGDREVESVSNLLRGQLHGLVRSLGNDESAETAESIERSLLGYRGRIETEVFVTSGDRDAEFAVEGHMVWLDDEETELGKLCADLESIARGALGDGLRAVEVEGHSYTVLESHDGGVSLPALDADGNAVLYFGSDPTSAIANGVARRERNRESDLARVAAISPFDLLSIDVDLERVIALSRTGHSDSSAEQLMARVFGFGTYRHARASVSTNGPHLQFELAVSFGPGHRGIYEAFLPSIETLPHMLESLPLPADRAPVFACGHVRWRELWEVILDFAANFSLFQSKTRGLDEIRDTANEDAGFDIENDLLASVGTEFGVVYDLGVTRDAQDRADPDADGMCLVFEIRDDKAFDAVFEKLRGSPLRIDGKTEHAGTAIYSGRFLDRD